MSNEPATVVEDEQDDTQAGADAAQDGDGESDAA